MASERQESIQRKMVKLNIGCGKQRLDGYTNIDKYPTDAADIISPAHELKYADDSVDEILSSHMIEHLIQTELDLALAEWFRVLKSGGKLVIRCPNFELYVKEYLEGNEEYKAGWGLINIFGWQDRGEGMLHRTGFTVSRLAKLVGHYGFTVQRCETTQTRQKRGPEFRENGDIICEAIKP